MRDAARSRTGVLIGATGFPLGHRRAIRTTNLLERLFGEERRRTKVIPHAFGERRFEMIYAALIRAAEHWRGIKVSEFEKRQLRQFATRSTTILLLAKLQQRA